MGLVRKGVGGRVWVDGNFSLPKALICKPWLLMLPDYFMQYNLAWFEKSGVLFCN